PSTTRPARSSARCRRSFPRWPAVCSSRRGSSCRSELLFAAMSNVYSPLLTELIQALQCLPGVGQKSAQRMAFHLLDREREAARRLARTLDSAAQSIRHCERCRMLTEETVCRFCRSPQRDPAKLCVVETPADLLAIESSNAYSGRYFVLLGHLSPIDGIGPSELG